MVTSGVLAGPHSPRMTSLDIAPPPRPDAAVDVVAAATAATGSGGTEPERPKKDYPWFWCEEEPGTDPTGGKDFVGNRWNGVHLTLARKRKASG